MKFTTFKQTIFKLSLLGALCFFLLIGTAFADRVAESIDVFKKSEAVKPFFDKAYGYAVFPTIGKGGFVLGGAYGSGRVFKQDKITGTASLAKVSIGLQLGGQAFSEIIFFEDERSYNEFTSGSFEFDGSVSAVVITAAAQAQTSTQGNTAGASLGPATGTQAQTSYTKGMAVFVHTLGGLMYEMTLGGQKFSFDPL